MYLAKNTAARRKGGAFIKKCGEGFTERATLIKSGKMVYI